MSLTVAFEEEVRHFETRKDGEVKQEAELGSKIDVLRDVALSLWKEVQSLGASTGVAQIERGISLYDEVRRFEIDLIRRALEQTGGNQTRAARLLGINLTTLNSKIKRYNISPDASTYKLNGGKDEAA